MSELGEFKCPFCAGRVYRGSVYCGIKERKQVYRCNNLIRTGIDCPCANEAVGRTKQQVRRAYAEQHETTE